MSHRDSRGDPACLDARYYEILRLGLKAGVQFVVVADRDVVILKVLDPPALGEFASLVAEARQAAKRSGLRQADVSTAITKVRRGR